MSGHRWSGWPGAWCLDCGSSDPVEAGLSGLTILVGEECAEPHSHRHDPYWAQLQNPAICGCALNPGDSET